MQISIHSDINDFLDIVQPELRKNEAANNLMLGVALRVQEDPYVYGDRVFCATFHENDVLSAAALMTSPYNLLIYCNSNDCTSAWSSLIDELQRSKWNVPGVFGQIEHAQAFADAWKHMTNESIKDTEQRRTFELRRVIWPKMPSGSMRQVKMEDLSLVSAWENAFDEEALGENEPHISVERTRKQIENSELFLWVDGQPVSMAAAVRPIGNGISVSWVFTPPEMRCKGYAGALVATLSQHLLDSGYSYCTLFTDLANPISNSIYQRIGYQPVCDYEMIYFQKLNG